MRSVILRSKLEQAGVAPASRTEFGAWYYNSLPDTFQMTNKATVLDEAQFQVLRLLQNNPVITQRQLAGTLDVSLGKINYCLKALLDKGLVKVQNFRGNQNKLAYAYLLTPKGVAEKAALTATFLKRKMQEYERLQAEIESLKQEVGEGRAEGTSAL